MSHRNLGRRWRGFELGVIGGNNTIPHQTVIPSLPEILYPALLDPWKPTIEEVEATTNAPFKLKKGLPPVPSPAPEPDSEDIIGRQIQLVEELERVHRYLKASPLLRRGSETEQS